MVVLQKPHSTIEQSSLKKEFKKITIVKYRNTQSILHNKDNSPGESSLSELKSLIRTGRREFLPPLSSPDFLCHLKGEKNPQLAVRLQENRQEQCSREENEGQGRKAVSLEEHV